MQKSKKAPKKQSLAAKKTPVKPAGKKVVKTAAVKAAPKKAAAPAKAPIKKVLAPIKAAPKKDLKPTTTKTAPVKLAPALKVAPKAAPASAPVKLKATVKKEDLASAKAAAPAIVPADVAVAKAAKGKKVKPEELPPEPEEEIVLLDAEGRRYCRVRECDQSSAVDGYCRFHYLLYWKNIQVRKKILSEGKLERYIEELTARYPDKYLEMLKKDLRSEKEFLAAIQELEIDESSVDNDYEDEAQNYLDEVRGMSSETGSNDRDEEF